MKTRVLLVLLCGGALAAQAQPGPGFALRFNDNASYVAVPQAVGLNSFPFTVMAWVNTSAGTGQQGLVNKYVANSLNGWNLFLKDGRVRAWYFASNTRFVWDGSDGLDGGAIANGGWHHVAFTVDGSGGRLYVDGVLRASRAWTGTSGPPSTSQEMRFGNYPGGILSFNGPLSLDEITVWNAALSQSQVAANMFTPLAGNEANLVALYRCDEGGGTSVADSAPLGGSNHGAWAGTPVFAPTVVAPQARSEGGASRGDCSGTPGITELKLDWRGQNVAGCKVDLDWSRSRIRRVAPDCSTIYYADLPSEAPRRWSVLSQPIGSDIDVEVTPVSARLPLPVAGNYTVQLEVCPGDCVVPGPDGNNFPMVPSTITVTLRAEPELPLRAQERPVLPPSAMVPTPRLALSDSQLNCLSQGGGGVTHPQWVTINPWTGPNDYRLVEGSVVSAWPSKGTAFRCGVSGCSTAGACRLTPRFIRQSAGLCIAAGPCAFPTARRSRLIWRRTWSPPPRATIFTCRASSVICGSTRIPGAPLAEMRAVSSGPGPDKLGRCLRRCNDSQQQGGQT